MQKIVLQVSGGIGKHVAATAVVRAIRKQYPDGQLIVVSAYPIVFRHNPYIDKNIAYAEQLSFYDNYIRGANPKPLFLFREPYNESGFINGDKTHLIKVWCEALGIAYNGELPELFLTRMEYERYFPLFNAGNGLPNMVMQTHGGAAPANPDQPNPHPYSWARDIPASIAQEVVEAFKGRYNIFHIRRKDQPALQHTFPVADVDFRAMAVLIAMSDIRLFMDSFAQHTAAALGKPSVVCWIANDPEQFGYKMHHNIIAPPGTLRPDTRNSVYREFDISGIDIQCPYADVREIMQAEKIIAALQEEPVAKVVAKSV